MSITARLKKGETTSPTESPRGRENLRFWHRELAGALHEEAEAVALVASLKGAVEAGERAETSAVAGLVAGRGQPLENAGELSLRIANGALAAKALPHAEEKLATARSEATRLRAEVAQAAKRQLAADAASAIAEYNAKAAELTAIYDRLVGIKGALLGEAGHQAMEIPLFRMTPNAETAIRRHASVDALGDPRRTTLQATADWTKALDRLIADPNADLSDLTGQTVA